MTLDELQQGLADRNAAIVHFSHHADTRPGSYFPHDLKNAIANNDTWPLSCCVLWPGHQMNLPGSIGVIFEPVSLANILSVCEEDSGSYFAPDGTDLSAGEPLSVDAFARTFSCEPGRYNEWRVRGTSVKGIFVANPDFILVKQPASINIPEMPDYLRGDGVAIVQHTIQLSEVFDAFPGLPVLSMGHTGIVELRRPAS